MMTSREFYEAIIKGEMTDEVVAKATEELSKLDSRNSKRAEAKFAKRAIEYAPIEEAIMALLADGQTLTTTEIASAVELDPRKVSPRCKALVEAGRVTEVDIKVPKVGMRKGYHIVG